MDDEYEPTEQLKQTADVDAPVLVEYLPDGHPMHVAALLRT